MGFYAPAQLVRDAREHGVAVLPVDVMRSEYYCTLEVGPRGGGPAQSPPAQPALRLGLRMVKGLTKAAAQRLVEARRESPFESVDDCRRRTRLDRRQATLLASAGAFAPLERNRHAAWWDAAPALKASRLFDGAPPLEVEAPVLAEPTLPERVVADYALTGLSLEAHPLSLLRPRLAALGARPCAVLKDVKAAPHGSRLKIAGLVLLRQRPATASGVLFMTLEDESGIANLVVWRREQEVYRAAVLESRLLLVSGRVERDGEVVHLLARRLEDLTQLVRAVPTTSRDFH
jgi:error-prone DNA polymerase